MFNSGKKVVFGKKLLYSGKSCCICSKTLYSAIEVVFGAKCLLSGKVVVIGQKLLYSGKSGCIRESGCIRA